MKDPIVRSLCRLWVLGLISAPICAAEPAFEPRTERWPAVVDSERAFPRQDVPRDLLAAFAHDPRPLSLAAGDFDGDGMPDLAVGYAIEGGSHGLVALWRGNVDTLFPWSPEARRRRAEGTFTEVPFLGPPTLFAVPDPPELLAADTFDGDAHVDLATAGAASAPVQLLAGNGRGGLRQAVELALTELPAGWAAARAEPGEEAGSGPIAVLEMRLNSDAFADLVMLEAGSPAPAVVVTSFDRTFTVDIDGDETDDSLPDGSCATAGGACTLRAAIEQANDLGGSTQIAFDIPGGVLEPRVITVLTELPHLTAAITIDGTTQDKVIAIDGDGNFAAPGLTLKGDQVVRSIYIWEFGGSAIKVVTGTSFIEGCRIGKTSDFANVAGSGNLQGIEVAEEIGLPPDVTIGGSAPEARNIITGNPNFGISCLRSATIEGNFIGTNTVGGAIPTDAVVQSAGISVDVSASPSLVEIRNNLISGNDVGVDLVAGASVGMTGNKIGTNAAGDSALANRVGVRASLVSNLDVGGPNPADGNLISGNTESAIEVSGAAGQPLIQGNLIGTTVSGATALANGQGIDVTGTAGPDIRDNVISGNTGHGVFLHGSEGTVFLGNYIGTDSGGTAPLGNGGHGVWAIDTSGTLIGASSPVLQNRIAFNGAAGVGVGAGGSVAIRANQVFSNGRLGIDLVDAMFLWDGVTLNDPLDDDVGPNNLQNYPLIDDVVAGQVSGSLHSRTNRFYKIEIYANSSCDPSGFGEGETFLEELEVQTSSGIAVWTSSAGILPAGQYATARARENVFPDASEFSPCRREHASCPYPPDLVLTDAQVVDTQALAACHSITTDGDFEIGLAANVSFTAGETVILGNHFKVLGELTVAIDPALAVP